MTAQPEPPRFPSEGWALKELGGTKSWETLPLVSAAYADWWKARAEGYLKANIEVAAINRQVEAERDAARALLRECDEAFKWGYNPTADTVKRLRARIAALVGEKP